MYSVLYHDSLFVSVNEACYSDLQYLRGFFVGYDSIMGVAKAQDEDCRGMDKRFGNLVFMLGTRANHSSELLPNPGKACQVATVECRIAICLTVENLLGRMTGCSSHLTNDHVPTAQSQATAYRNFAVGYAPSSLRWIAGDFNLTIGQVPPAYGNNHVLMNYGYTVNPRATLNKQIDHVWWRSPPVTLNYLPAFCPPDASDHCLVETELVV
ncbi:hypothetical protein [Gordonia sp. (in: high G+C Gram-positive bacteria)]|uniref:hypothetical protein n=1 Tax=Gordonia sp. (in: high G+C Gram-positive bacteria) TaxID=84139 RepID=UPI0016939F4D|nr:hypothetical protein [Gordonia sp. (in: high G+C Gram-positive bacteria)]NLG45583.1 endonuclease/exonuclease/phosphatase family protein [Gordonia sp. (in: high G+C Gram-positive bacteria)]